MIETEKNNNGDIPPEKYRATVSLYDPETDGLIDTFTGTFTELVSGIQDYQKFNYRLPYYEGNVPFCRVYTYHFGVKTSCIMGLEYCERDYMNAFLNRLIRKYYKCVENQTLEESDYFFRFNFHNVVAHKMWMDVLAELTDMRSEEGFNSSLNNFISKNERFTEIDNIDRLSGISGCYLLVLDKYKLYYVGQATDIRKRIMRHWSRSDFFMDHGIDLFKPLDTTRIFVDAWSEDKDEREYHYVKDLDPRYTVNILAGGKPDYFADKTEEFMITNAFSRIQNYDNIWDKMKDDNRRVARIKDIFVME